MGERIADQHGRVLLVRRERLAELTTAYFNPYA
jgi:hypothetical protein